MKHVLAAVTLLTLAVTAGSVRADPLPPTAKAEAQARYDKGNEYFDRAEQTHDPALYEQAYFQFAQAYAIYPDEKVLWNLAMSELSTKRFVDALHHFRQFEADHHVLETPTDPSYALLKSSLEEATKKTARLKIDAVAGTEILVDGKSAGTAPLAAAVDVLPGKHEVQTADAKQHATVDAAAGAELDISLEPPTVLPPSGLPASPSASVTNDGPTVHDLVPPEPPRSFWTARREVGVAVSAIGLVALGFGFYFNGQASDAQSQAAASEAHLGLGACTGMSQPAGCAGLSSAYSSQNTDATWSRVLYGVGALGLVAGAALILWPSSSSSHGSTAILPILSPYGGGLQLRGEL